MNYVLVVLTFLILAWVLISCAVLGSDRLAGAEHVSKDGLDAPRPAGVPYTSGSGAEESDEGRDDPDAESERAGTGQGYGLG